MLTHPTEQRLIALGLAGMAKALEEQRRLSAFTGMLSAIDRNHCPPSPESAMQGGVIGPARLAALFLTCVEPSLILAVAQLDLSKAMGEERMNRNMTSMGVACILLYAVTPASAQENDPGAWR